MPTIISDSTIVHTKVLNIDRSVHLHFSNPLDRRESNGSLKSIELRPLQVIRQVATNRVAKTPFLSFTARRELRHTSLLLEDLLDLLGLQKCDPTVIQHFRDEFASAYDIYLDLVESTRGIIANLLNRGVARTLRRRVKKLFDGLLRTSNTTHEERVRLRIQRRLEQAQGSKSHS